MRKKELEPFVLSNKDFEGKESLGELINKLVDTLENISENAEKVIFDIPYMQDYNCETKWVDELRHDIRVAKKLLDSLSKGGGAR